MKDITIPPVKRGDTWNFKFTWQDQNTPINLTDCTARMQIRDKTTLLMAAEATTANGQILIDGPTGGVTVTFTATETTSIAPGRYVSDLELTFTGTGIVQSSDTMHIIVIEDITR